MKPLILSFFAFLGGSGCAGFNAVQLAPPGIIRYERIADEKPANPQVAEQIQQRRTVGEATFPKIGDTAAGGAKRGPIPDEGVDQAVDELVSARDELKDNVEEDREVAILTDEEAEAINKAADELSKDISNAKAAAARE